jgi:hypothetical protein
MAEYVSEGNLLSIGQIEETPSKNGGKSYKKCKFVIETNEEASQSLEFEAFGDFMVKQLSEAKLNNYIKVVFRIDSNEYKEKHYPKLCATMITTFKTMVFSKNAQSGGQSTQTKGSAINNAGQRAQQQEVDSDMDAPF